MALQQAPSSRAEGSGKLVVEVIPSLVAPLVFLTLKGLSLGGASVGHASQPGLAGGKSRQHVDPSSFPLCPLSDTQGPAWEGAWEGHTGGLLWLDLPGNAMAPACKLVGNFGEKILVRPQNFCGFLWVFWSLEGTENNHDRVTAPPSDCALAPQPGSCDLPVLRDVGGLHPTSQNR